MASSYINVNPALSRSFRIVWAATGISNLGDGISLVALPLLAASLTQDPALIAAIATAQRLPWLFFSLISGVVVDRADRRVVQRNTNFLRALVLALTVVLLPIINNRTLTQARLEAQTHVVSESTLVG